MASCFSRRDALKHVRWGMLTLKGQCQNLTSDQGHVVAQIDYAAYQSMQFGEANTLGPSTVFYLYSVKSYRHKNNIDFM